MVQLPEVYLARDYPRSSLHHAWRKGELIRIRRGAYMAPVEEIDARDHVLARCVAVARALRGEFAFSHQTAAVLHGLPVQLDRVGVVHVIQTTRPASDRATDVRTHVVPDLPGTDVTAEAGLPLTTLRRTVVDVARTSRPRQGLSIVDAALRSLAGTTRFNDTADAEARIRENLLARLDELGSAPGTVRARAVITHADGRAESPPESELRWLLLSEHFPAPVLQMAVHTDRATYYPDLGWRAHDSRSKEQPVALEYDGVAKYGSTGDLYQEKQREDALRRAGCHVIRVTKGDLRGPGALLQSLRGLVRPELGAFPERVGLRMR